MKLRLQSFQLTGLISLLSKGLSRVFSNTTVQKHQFFSAQLSIWTNSHNMTTGKTKALTRWTFVGKAMSLLFNMLSRFVMAFLPMETVIELEPYMEQQTVSKLGKEYIKAVYCHPVYLTHMQSTSCEMLNWMNHKLESKMPGEISTTSDMQMIPL